MKFEEKAVEATETSAEQTSGWLLVNARMLIGLVGAVACYAWLFLALGTSSFIPFSDLSSNTISGGHLCFVFGVVLALLAVWRLSDWFASHKIVHFTIAFVLAIIGDFGLWFLQGQSPLFCIPSISFGLGFGLLYPLYGEFICIFFYGYVKPYVHGIFACAAFLCMGLLFAGEQLGFFFSSIFPAAAFVAYAFVLIFFKLQDRPVVEKTDSDARHRVVWRSYLATATSGMAAGYGLGCLMSIQDIRSWAYVAVAVFVLAVCILLLIDSLKRNLINETLTMRLFLPLSAVVVFPLIFAPDDWKFVFALLLICGSLFPTTCSISAILRHIIICDLSAIRAFSLGRLVNFLGIEFGFAIAFMGFAPVFREAYGSLASVASVVLFMLLVIFSASFVMTEDNYPDGLRFRASGTTGDSSMSVASGTPIRKIESTVGENSAGHIANEDDFAQRPGAFHIKCEIVSNKYDLSSRQREVLSMLAKGRNADYITDKLVISSHTAKAHIYNIYQKTGVHSRQELMDLVENTDIHEGDTSDFAH